MSGIELTNKGYQKFDDENVGDGHQKDQIQSARATENKAPTKYDPLSIPASIQMAEDHFKATRIAKEVKKKVQNIDDQSGFPVDNHLIPICSDLDELSFLSSGTPMYFQYLKFMIYILIVLLITSCTYSLYSNYHGNGCLDPETVSDDYKKNYDAMSALCIKNPITLFSLSNNKDNGFVLEKQEIYNLFTAALLIFMIHYLAKSQKETAVRLDVEAITAADFTIQIKNFPRNFDEENVDFDNEIKKFVSELGLPGRKVNVQDVNVSYDLRVKNEKLREIKKIVAQREILLAEKEAGKADASELDKLDHLDQEYANLRKEVEEISAKFTDGKSVKEFFSGEAYVTVETQQEVQDLVKHWNLSFFKRIREAFNSESTYKYKGELIIIRQAPEPSDVIWENSGIPAYQIFFRRLFSYTIITSSVIFFSIAIMISTGVKKSLIDDYQRQALTSDNPNIFKTEAMIVSSIVSGFIVVVNYIFKAIISFFSGFSKYESSTEYLQTYSTALAWAQFLNTAIVSAVINAFTDNLWGPSGLVITAFQVQLFDILLGWGISFVDVGSFLGYCRRRQYRKKAANGENILRTQEELNRSVFEYPKYDFATKYAFYIKLLLSAAFYASLSPLMVALTIVGIFIGYWFEKYIFLRKRSRGISYGSELPLHLTDFLKYSVVFFALGNLFFHSYVRGYDGMDAIITLVTLFGALFNAVLPTDTVIEYFFPRPQETVTDETYSAKKKFLVEDYRRFNPAFKEEAIAEFTRMREAKKEAAPIVIDSIKKEKVEEPIQDAAKEGDLESGKNEQELKENGLNIN